MAQQARTRIKAAVLAVVSIAAIATGASVASAAAGRPAAPVRAAATAASAPVVINCKGQPQTEPGQYFLACADGNAYLSRLHWAAWGSPAAFGRGSYVFNDCVPDCVGGALHSFPVLTAVWRAEPRPGHAGARYFTRLTIIFTGSHSYRAGGKVYHLPGTVTFPLSAGGGA